MNPPLILPPPPPKPTDRMVRVKNVSRRAIIEAGQTYKPGAELELSEPRVRASAQRVRRLD